jgi:hypothetical protein
MRQVRDRLVAGVAWVFPSFSAQDLHLWAGLAAVAIGFEQIYHPLIWIVPGTTFTWLAWPKRAVMMKPRKDS